MSWVIKFFWFTCPFSKNDTNLSKLRGNIQYQVVTSLGWKREKDRKVLYASHVVRIYLVMLPVCTNDSYPRFHSNDAFFSGSMGSVVVQPDRYSPLWFEHHADLEATLGQPGSTTRYLQAMPLVTKSQGAQHPQVWLHGWCLVVLYIWICKKNSFFG